MRNVLRTTALLWVLLLPLSALAEVAQPTPMPNAFVHDFAGVISGEKKAEIQSLAQQLKDKYQTEIAVVTIDSLQGEDSFDYSLRMARSWGIGSKDNDVRGLLILVAVKDRKTAFRTSRHIEGELPDGVTGEISRRMNGYFKKGDFGGGLSSGVGMILERLKAADQPLQPVGTQPVAAQTTRPDSGWGWLWLPIMGLAPFGLGYAILHRRSKKRREGDGARRATSGGFRAWATSVDPSTTPKVKRKTPGHTKSAPKRSSRTSRRSSETSSFPEHGITNLGSDDSGSSSPGSSLSSYDSGSSSGVDSGSSYSGGSDFGGGGSDSSW
jgi:uncharacterized membrane protein YgcG